MRLNINIDETDLCKITTEDEFGIKKNRYIEYSELINLLVAAQTEQKKEDINKTAILSDILPGDSFISCVQVKELPTINSKWYILLRQQKKTDFKLGIGNNEKLFKDVNMPKMIFAVKVCNDKAVSLKITCIKNNEIFIKENTKLYAYPFSNVYGGGNVCLGGNSISDFYLEDLSNIVLIPEMFLAMNNSSHAYSHKSNMNYEELLIWLQTNEFNDDLFRESSFKSYNDFIKSLE